MSGCVSKSVFTLTYKPSWLNEAHLKWASQQLASSVFLTPSARMSIQNWAVLAVAPEVVSWSGCKHSPQGGTAP